ncbi:MAG: heavy metal translocating P-type ATPase, partial [Bacillota bacterium]|nr:heavy metal translocating P-type ATPase [Bacillota bacterium]
MIEFIIFLAIYLIVGGGIVKEAIENVIHGEWFDENFLMCVATIGAFIMGEYSEAIIVMVLYRIGEWLEDKAVDKSRDSITDLMDIRPDYANLLNGETESKVSPADLHVGDTIVIKPGERVPVDCEIISGQSRIDTAALTGEALPVDVNSGSQLYSGSINLDGMITAKVLKIASESTASRILKLVEDAADSKAKAENFITKFAKVYTPVVCALALVCAVVPPLLNFGTWHEWIYRALEFLIISCPCALVISIPLAFFGGIGGASSKGILIKGGNYLEALSKAKTVVFDKTGTLTRGVFKVVAVHPTDCDEERLLELATLAESFSNHPIARSLADAYGQKPDKSRVSEFREFAGKGVLAKIDGHHIAAGNRLIMEHIGCDYHDCEHPGTRVHVALDGHYMGHVIISDEIKEDAKEAVTSLNEVGIKTVMLTGDKEDMAAATAEELGVKEYKAECMPEDKINYIEGLMNNGLGEDAKLAFVGDGINDAPALTRADVGVAMGAMGSAAAVEAADIVLMNDKPSDVALAVRHSKRVMKIIYEDITLSLGIKVVVLIASA